MKRILMPLVVAAMALAMVACGTKTTKTDKDMNTLTFTTKQAAAMTVIACNEARGDLSSLAGATHCDLYDGGEGNYIPWDTLAEFFSKNL